MCGKLALVLLLLAPLASAQMAQQAQMAAQRPAKIDVVPMGSQNAAGQPVPVQIQLLDASGQPIPAREPVNAELVVKQPSGQTAVTNVTLSPGESTKKVDLNIPEPGITELKVRQSAGQLIGSTNYTLITASQKRSRKPAAGKSARHKKAVSEPGKPTAYYFGSPELRPIAGAKLLLAAYSPDDSGSTTAPEPDLMLKVSGEDAGGGVRADGKTCARVQVFYTGANQLDRDVEIWLRWSNGAIDSNPLIIRRKSTQAMACWTSLFPISAATVQIAAVSPSSVTFAHNARETVEFSENIRGIDFANPPTSITIVDNVNLSAVFYDPVGNPVKLVSSRNLLFNSSNPIIRINPQHATVAPGNFDSSTILIPTYFGKSKIEVSTDGYPPADREIRVTWLTVMLGIIFGGLLGGWLAFLNSGGKLWTRIMTGLIVGFFASWAYVLVGLPKVEASILHNQLSVIFVSLAAAFSGVKVISVISGKLNFGF